MRSISYQKNASTLVTMKDVEEVRLRLKKKAEIEATPPSILPSVSFSLPLIPARNIEKSHWRTSLILALKEHLSKRDGLIKDAMNEFCKKYNTGLFLPNIYEKVGEISVKTLYRFKLKFEKRGGVDALIPQYGGLGKSKVTDHEKNFLLAILLHQNCLKIGFAIKILKNHFKKIGLESPSSTDTLRRFVDQWKKEHPDKWTLYREGEKALDDKFLPYIERDRNLLEVGDCLVADGHRLNFQAINPFTGLSCRPVIVFFYDWRSNYPCGWEIMLEEDTQCIASAARNAILALGKIPKVIYIDNGRAFKGKYFTSNVNLADDEIAGMFHRLKGLREIYFAQPYNAKAKIVERFFRIFNDWFEKTWESYIGSSINDKPAYMRRNEKIARSLHNDRIPKISEVNEALFKFREFYSDQPSRALGNQTPREIFNAGKGPGVDPFELNYLMMERKITTIHRNGFTLFGCNWDDEEGALYNYRDQVIIKYSLFDLSQIYVFDMKNNPLCAVKPILKVHPTSSVSDTPKDVEEFKRQIARKRRLKRQTTNDVRRNPKALETLPWRKIIQEVPNTVEALEKIEAEKPVTKNISPFVDDPAEERKEIAFEDNDLGEFNKDNWQLYDEIMAKDPKTWTPKQIEFIEYYKTTTEYQSILHCSEANLIREEP
jgi:putative transposase